MLVVVDPDAGIVAEAPIANPTARDDVEKALMRWGRFTLVQNGTDADLIITVRKGNGKIAQQTIGGVPINNRPVILQPTDSGGRIGLKTPALPLRVIPPIIHGRLKARTRRKRLGRRRTCLWCIAEDATILSILHRFGATPRKMRCTLTMYRRSRSSRS